MTAKPVQRNGENTTTPYHHGNLKVELLEVGLKLLNDKNNSNISLREVARLIGVSPNAVYRHFADKDSYIAALAVCGFEKLIAQQVQAWLSTGGGEAGVSLLARQYIDFAVNNSTLFQLMFGRFSADNPNPMVLGISEQSFNTTLFVVAELLKRSAEDPEVLKVSVFVWSFVHGMSHLIIGGQLNRLLQTNENLIEGVLGFGMELSKMYLDSLQHS